MSFTLPPKVSDIPPDFVRLVSNHISSFDTFKQIIGNLNILNPSDIKVSKKQLHFEIACMLNNLTIKISQASPNKYASFCSNTPDVSEFSHIIHFDSICINSTISFDVNTNGGSATFRVVFKKGLASWCNLLVMTITQPSY